MIVRVPVAEARQDVFPGADEQHLVLLFDEIANFLGLNFPIAIFGSLDLCCVLDASLLVGQSSVSPSYDYRPPLFAIACLE